MFGGRWLVAGSVALGLQITFMSLGCAYRLPPVNPPGHYRLRLVASSPENYVISVQTLDVREYQVPADGRMTLDVPASRPGCSVYLFDRIRLREGDDPFARKTVHLASAGGYSRDLSFNELFKLPQDGEGYHLLKTGK
jgi:hypothetical protein